MLQTHIVKLQKNLYFFIHADKKVQVFVYDLTSESFSFQSKQRRVLTHHHVGNRVIRLYA